MLIPCLILLTSIHFQYDLSSLVYNVYNYIENQIL